ncbi:MAG TPA: ROK family protein, partial [Verrucomicrobiae bacterium]|nr:ROK family protein [Verrucomicrobiae bacterium]
MFRIGIDLGGTKTEGIVLDDQSQEIFRKRIETQRENGYDHILNCVKGLYGELATHIQHHPHTLGLGAPGVVSPRTGLMKNANTVCLIGKPLKADLEQTLSRKIEIQNGVNCFALAEALQGTGRGHKLVFGVIMGTGCGGGIVHNGEVILGRQAIVGEWGHTSIALDGPRCYCGKQGCVETYISGGGAEARYAEQFEVKKSFQAIVQDFYEADSKAEEFMRTFFRHFGRAMANLIDV